MKFRRLLVVGFFLVALATIFQTKEPLTKWIWTSASYPHLLFGNPTHSQRDLGQPDNYLIEKKQFALSYNRTNGIPNWVSWQLNKDWLGEAPRQNDFRPDPDLPDAWSVVTGRDYGGSGFDRGHLVPSEDRGDSINDNSSTFVMTNIIPMSPDNNRGPWEKLESYSRRLVNQGKELYIIAGGDGEGGTGSRGRKTRLGRGKVLVPARLWKIVVVMESSPRTAGLGAINPDTRVIAVVIPNRMGIANADWRDFRISVDALEDALGVDFLSNLPSKLQDVLEKRIDQR